MQYLVKTLLDAKVSDLRFLIQHFTPRKDAPAVMQEAGRIAWRYRMNIRYSSMSPIGS